MPRQILLTATAITLVACTQQPTYSPPPVDPVQSMRAYHKGVERRAIASMHDIATAGSTFPEGTFEAETIVKVRSSMKDPDTAKFRNLRVISYGSIGRLVCGEVAGMNSFGAYTGFIRFAGTPGDVAFEATGGTNNWINQSLSAGITDACGPGE